MICNEVDDRQFGSVKHSSLKSPWMYEPKNLFLSYYSKTTPYTDLYLSVFIIMKVLFPPAANSKTRLPSPGFDRIHACTKVQKPYVFTRVALSVEADQPVEM